MIPSTPKVRGPDIDDPMTFLVGCLRWLDKRSSTAVCIIAGTLILGIGVLSYATGPQLSSSLFYLIPVLLVTWVAGLRSGGLAALAAAIMWLATDLNADSYFTHPATPYWNAASRLGTFLVVVSLVSAMRTLNAHLEERVIERTAALEAEIIEKRELEKTILEISDLERAKIGQDLHDGLCQQLVSAAFSANMLQQSLTKDSAGGNPDANRIADMIDDAITQARNLARGLYPVRLETEGLEMALRELASGMSRRFEIPCIVECLVPILISNPSDDIHLYRIAQEAVVNAAKHANPSRIILSLSSLNARLTLKIQDDGTGIGKTPSNPEGMGLRIMEYRARMIGADFRVSRQSTSGTEVVCVVDRYGGSGSVRPDYLLPPEALLSLPIQNPS
jgi:signal transduction histidine kinase